jgi:hypothetical protein
MDGEQLQQLADVAASPGCMTTMIFAWGAKA